MPIFSSSDFGLSQSGGSGNINIRVTEMSISIFLSLKEMTCTRAMHLYFLQ